jgi:hypothetical protein
LTVQIKQRARNALFDFDQPEWLVVSPEAKDLLRRLIVKDPTVGPCSCPCPCDTV